MIDFNRSIRQVISSLNDIGFLQTTGTPSSLIPQKSFKHLCLHSRDYREIYTEAVKYSIFNVMMNDGAFFQFTETTAQEEIRLAFYPRPPDITVNGENYKEVSGWLEAGDIDQFEFEQLLNEMRGDGYCVPIRYDLSIKQYCENFHPASHLHIGFLSENRWPVSHIFSPESFFWMIMFNCYPALWKEIKLNTELLCPENKYMRAASTAISLQQDYFTNLEKSRFHFSRNP